MKKDYVIDEPVSAEWINNVIGLACKLDNDVYSIEGGLNDAYMIEFKGLHYGRVRRNWLLVIPEFANTWSNHLHVMLTDNKKIASEFYGEWEKQQDSDGDYYPALAGRWFDTFAQQREKILKKILD